MKLSSIEINNFRKFEKLFCALHPSMTVLVSENGGGKTTLLDAARIALWPFVKGFDLGSQTGKSATIAIEDVRLVHQIEGNMEPARESSKIAVGTDWLKPNDEMVIERTQIKKNTGNLLNKEAAAFTKQAKKLQNRVRNGEDVDLPLISYLGTSRVWYQGRNTIQEKELVLNTQDYSRTSAYLNCLSYSSSYKAFAVWFTHICKSRDQLIIRLLKHQERLASYAYLTQNLNKAMMIAHDLSSQEAKDIERVEIAIEVIQSSINSIIQPITGWYNLEYNELIQQKLVMHHDELGVLPVDMLSDGLRNAIAMVADIAFRAYKLNPHMGKEAAKQTTGIVMIDEVDMFLHPKWQQTILPSLQEAFPKIQFIVTTHSPQVLSTVKRENIRIIGVNAEGATVAEMPEFHPLGHESGDALSHIMSTPTRPLLAFDEQIVTYEQLVRSGQEDSPEAQKIKQELDKNGYVFKESDLATWRFLASRRRTSL